MSSVQSLPIAPQSSEDPLSNYALQMLQLKPETSVIDTVLGELEHEAAVGQIPIIGHLEGAILQVLTAQNGRRILELGTAIGYSALWLARSLPKDGRLVTIELDPERADHARDVMGRAELSDRVQVITGDIFQVLPQLNGPFDVIFQDVIKHAYFQSSPKLAVEIFDLCLSLLAPGGLLLGDNAFCLGEVLDTQDMDNRVQGIRAYNERVATHPQLQSVIIPVRDGLWVSRKTY